MRIRPLTTERGRILDCNGKALAENGTAYRIGIVPGRFDMDRLEEFCDHFELELDYVEGLLEQSWVGPDTYVPILTKSEFGDLEYQAARDFDLQIDALDRLYPYGRVYRLPHRLPWATPPRGSRKARIRRCGVSDKIGRAGIELVRQRAARQNGFQPRHGANGSS